MSPYSIAIGAAEGKIENDNVTQRDITIASANNAIAIGHQAKALANDAIQLGVGTNSNAKTLQFNGYPVIDADGYIFNDRIRSSGIEPTTNTAQNIVQMLSTPGNMDVVYDGTEGHVVYPALIGLNSVQMHPYTNGTYISGTECIVQSPFGCYNYDMTFMEIPLAKQANGENVNLESNFAIAFDLPTNFTTICYVD